jgi:glycosyltransferase involved in cell wall biosynthesis
MGLRVGVSALAMRGSRSGLNSGIARYCAGLIEAWIEDDGGHQFEVWISGAFEVPAAWRRNRNVEFHVAHGPWAGHKTLWELFAGGRAATASACDVWFSTAHAVPLASPVPVVLSVQDLFTFSHPRFYTWKHRLVIGWALRRALRQADGLVAISLHTRAELASRFDIDERAVAVTPLGLGRQVAPIAPESVSVADLRALGVGGGDYLLTLSTVEPRKNLERLFEAFALVAAQPERLDLRLVVAGRRGWKTAPIYRRPRELGLGDRIDFVGYIPDEDLPKLFARCRAFVLPSVIEGFGLPLLEAMAFGVPVAASDTGSLVEVGGDVPFYFDPEDSVAMAAAIELALAAERARLAEAGRARAAEFSWQRTAEATLAVLVSVAGRG